MKEKKKRREEEREKERERKREREKERRHSLYFLFASYYHLSISPHQQGKEGSKPRSEGI